MERNKYRMKGKGIGRGIWTSCNRLTKCNIYLNENDSKKIKKAFLSSPNETTKEAREKIYKAGDFNGRLAKRDDIYKDLIKKKEWRGTEKWHKW